MSIEPTSNPAPEESGNATATPRVDSPEWVKARILEHIKQVVQTEEAEAFLDREYHFYSTHHNEFGKWNG